jgi:Erv1 / Alr family
MSTATKIKTEPPYYTLNTVGPGVWYVIHLLAALGRLQILRDLLNILGNYFLCKVCRDHIKEVVNVPERPQPDVINYELFCWSVLFHNSVNRRKNTEEHESKKAPIFCKEDADNLLKFIIPNDDDESDKLPGTCSTC